MNHRVTNGTVRVYMGEAEEMPQGKVYQQYFENTENKTELIDRYSKYIQQDHVRSKLKGNVIFNYIKAKDTDILILIIYAYADQQPEQDFFMQTDQDSFVSIRKIYENLGSTTCLLLPQFHATTGCDTVSYFSNVSKRVVFERVSSGHTPFNMIVDKIYSKEAEGIVETRMRQYNEIKRKATQVILPDPNNLTHHIKRVNIQAYYLVHCMNKDIKKCDQHLSGWKREEETGTFIYLWYDCNQPFQSMSKRSSSSAQLNSEKAVTGNDRPKRLSAAVAKINMELCDNFSHNESGTDSSYGLSDFSSENDSSDPDIYQLQKQLLVVFISL